MLSVNLILNFELECSSHHYGVVVRDKLCAVVLVAQYLVSQRLCTTEENIVDDCTTLLLPAVRGRTLVS